MPFVMLSVVVPFLVYYGSMWLVSVFHKEPSRHNMLLVAACTLYFISWYLPSPLIDGQDTSFTTHFVGGGLFTGILWLYFKQSFSWRGPWWLESFSLFALVSALGNANELFELLVVRTGLVHLALTDTNWDIFANSLGALVVYVGHFVYDTWHR